MPTAINEDVTVIDTTLVASMQAQFPLGSILEVQIGNNVTSIGDDAFVLADTLTRVTMKNAADNSLTAIGDNAFNGMVVLEDLSFLADAGSLATIESSAFFGCLSATDTLEIPAAVQTIGQGAFQRCISLQSIGLSGAAALATISDGAFGNCVAASGTLEIPAAVATIAGEAFGNCTALISIVFASSAVTVSLGTDAFSNITLTNALLGTLATRTVVDRSAGAVTFQA